MAGEYQDDRPGQPRPRQFEQIGRAYCTAQAVRVSQQSVESNSDSGPITPPSMVAQDPRLVSSGLTPPRAHMSSPASSTPQTHAPTGFSPNIVQMPGTRQPSMGYYPFYSANATTPQQQFATAQPLEMTPTKVLKNPSPAAGPSIPKANLLPPHHANPKKIDLPFVATPEVSPLTSPDRFHNKASISQGTMERLQASIARMKESASQGSSYVPKQISTGGDAQNNDFEIIDLTVTPDHLPQTKKRSDAYSNDEVKRSSSKARAQSKERTVSSAGEESVDVLDKYAFNLDRKAYEHGVPIHLTVGTVIYARKLSTTTLAQHRNDAGCEGVCPPLVPAPAEGRKSMTSKSIECVWVGMFPSQDQADEPSDGNAGEGSASKLVKHKAKPKASIADLSKGSMKTIPFDPNGLRVVARRSDKAAKAWFLYVLVNPADDNKRCEGFKVEFEKVYYFRQFRDDVERGFQARRVAMKERIMEKTFPALSVLHGSSTPAAAGSAPLPVSASPHGPPSVAPAEPFRVAKAKSSKSLAKKRAQGDEFKGEQGANEDDHPASKRSKLSPRAQTEKLKVGTEIQTGNGTAHWKTDKNLADKSACNTPSSHPTKLSVAPSRSFKASINSAVNSSASSSRNQPATAPLKTGHVIHDGMIKKLATSQGCAKSPSQGQAINVPVNRMAINDIMTKSGQDEQHQIVASAQEQVTEPKGDDLDSQSNGFSKLADTDTKANFQQTVEHQPLRSILGDGKEIGFSAQEKGKGIERYVSFRIADSRSKGKQSGRDQPQPYDSASGGYGGDDEEENGPQSEKTRQKGLEAMNKIEAAIQKLFAQGDVGALNQIATMVDSIKDRKAPLSSSALKPYLNVPSGETIDTKVHTEQLKQLLELFPTLQEETQINEYNLAWMIRGLQITGQTIDIELLLPFLIVFNEQFAAKFGDHTQTSRIPKKVLVNMICRSRDAAEEVLRIEAAANGDEPRGASHPYMDPREKMVWQTAVWEREDEPGESSGAGRNRAQRMESEEF